MAVVVPVWIARRNRVTFAWPDTFGGIAALAAGVLVGVAGLGLFAASLRRFATDGRGTLAPWDPPRRLVLRGPYRYVRNPMIAGVMFILAAIAFVLRSRPHGAWALTFAVINATYIPLLEEPLLEARFGDEYREYCRHVRRFIPRLTPWSPPGA
jgi:protein-S-isoprenylcysteine O-methyltransferase Ste14